MRVVKGGCGSENCVQVISEKSGCEGEQRNDRAAGRGAAVQGGQETYHVSVLTERPSTDTNGKDTPDDSAVRNEV